MRLLRSFLTLTPGERRALVKATFVLVVVQLALGRVPFHVLRRLITGRRVNEGQSLGGAAFVRHVVWAVTAASRRLPGGSTCLSRALSVQALLARAGYPSRLHFGVVRGDHDQLEGHAWVECDGRIVIGGSASEIGHFTPLAALDVESGLDLHTLGSMQGGR